jgi:hypothetical protein
MSPRIRRADLGELVGTSLPFARRVLRQRWGVRAQVRTRPCERPQGEVLAIAGQGELVTAEDLCLEVAGTDPLSAFEECWRLDADGAAAVPAWLDALVCASTEVVAAYVEELAEALHPFTASSPAQLAEGWGISDWPEAGAGSRSGLLGLLDLNQAKGSVEGWRELCRRLLGVEGELHRPGAWTPWLVGVGRAGELVAADADEVRATVVLEAEAPPADHHVAVARALASAWSLPGCLHMVRVGTPSSPPAAVLGAFRAGQAALCAPMTETELEEPWPEAEAASRTDTP